MGGFYGLRRSEVLGIRWSAIDFENKTITIRHKVVTVTDENENSKTKTKTITIAANEDDNPSEDQESLKVTLSKNNVNLVVGNTVKFTAKIEAFSLLHSAIC